MKAGKKGEPFSGEEEYRFMQEKIKRRPIDWKKPAKRVVLALGFGMLFGVAASFTMEMLRPAFAGLAKKEREEENLSLYVEQSEAKGIENIKEKPDGNPLVGDSAEEVDVATELQRLEAGIYQIAEDARPFMVDVMGIREELDWFEEINETESQSSGIIINMDNYALILTNRNVVKGAQYIRIRFCDGTILQGHEIGYDTPTNLSVIQVDNLSDKTREAVTVASFKGEEVSQGDLVIALGRPLGKYNTMVYGHISGQTVKRYTDALYRQIYTDIPASTEGQGILLNDRGQVLGLINQSLAEEGGENLITALGTLEIHSLVEKLMRGENPGYFGIEGEAFSSDKAGVAYKGSGVYVTKVKKDFPAMAAGIQGGDILTEVNGAKVTDVGEFQNEILKYTVGDKVQVTLMRRGGGEYKEMTFEIELGGY